MILSTYLIVSTGTSTSFSTVTILTDSTGTSTIFSMVLMTTFVAVSEVLVSKYFGETNG